MARGWAGPELLRCENDARCAIWPPLNRAPVVLRLSVGGGHTRQLTVHQYAFIFTLAFAHDTLTHTPTDTHQPTHLRLRLEIAVSSVSVSFRSRHPTSEPLRTAIITNGFQYPRKCSSSVTAGGVSANVCAQTPPDGCLCVCAQHMHMSSAHTLAGIWKNRHRLPKTALMNISHLCQPHMFY